MFGLAGGGIAPGIKAVNADLFARRLQFLNMCRQISRIIAGRACGRTVSLRVEARVTFPGNHKKSRGGTVFNFNVMIELIPEVASEAEMHQRQF